MVVERHLGGRHPREASVREDLALLERDDLLAGPHHLELHCPRRARMLLREEVEVGPAERFVRVLEPEPACERPAQPREPAFRVLEVHVVGRGVQERLQKVALVQGCGYPIHRHTRLIDARPAVLEPTLLTNGGIGSSQWNLKTHARDVCDATADPRLRSDA